MGLVKCTECAKDVSDKAEACPHCGVKRPKKTSMTTWAAGIFMVAIIGSYISSQDKARDAAAAKPIPSPEQVAAAKKSDDELISAAVVLRSIKRSMKNPKSFDLDSFLIFPGGGACYEFHATNSFNATVPGSAVFDPQKAILFTSDNDGNKFVSAWNKICTKSGGIERAREIKTLSTF